jgi:hypothetical protein
MGKGPDVVEVYLYGELRRYAPRREVRGESVVFSTVKSGDTVGEVIERLGIDLTEVSNIFHNGRLTKPGSKVRAGDRLGVFPTNMGLLYV